MLSSTVKKLKANSRGRVTILSVAVTQVKDVNRSNKHSSGKIKRMR